MLDLLKNTTVDSKMKEMISTNNNVSIVGATLEYQALLLAKEFQENSNKTYYYVANNIYNASKFYDLITSILGDNNTSFYPADEFITGELMAASIEFKQERMNTIYNILEGKHQVIVTHLSGWLKPVVPRDTWEKNKISLAIGKTVNRTEFINKLILFGYHRVSVVEDQGDFSVRGSVIDIYTLHNDYPIRIDFFDDEVDFMKYFDPMNQRTFKELNEIVLYPIVDFFYTDEQVDKVVETIHNSNAFSKLSKNGKALYNYDIKCLYDREEVERIIKYYKYFYKPNQTIVDFVHSPKVYFSDFMKIQNNYDSLILDLEKLYEESERTYNNLDFIYIEDIYSFTGKCLNIAVFNDLDNQYYKPYFTVLNTFNIATREVVLRANIFNEFVKGIKKINDYSIIMFASKDRLGVIRRYFDEYKIQYNIQNFNLKQKGIINLVQQDNGISIDFYEEKIILINEKDLFDKQTKKISFKGYSKEAKKIDSIYSLSIGDFLVHYDYGIGKFNGLTTMELDGVKNDYIQMEYKNGASLYVPVDKIAYIHRYSVAEGVEPRLSKLGSSDWEKTKRRVKKQIKDIADNLLRIYSERDKSRGYSFSKDTVEQAIFESNFEFEETEDQLIAIEDVKRDMESEKPMDRLICGDVGFGKTEIAMRAAFKAIMDGKQVAYLAPTTVLSRQHFYTFKERFDSFGASIGILNRFVKPSNVKKILKRVNDGLVDVLIGTHRILSKDVKFKDLGLLIIDEEQRFGVEHKEKIKELKANIDVITLTATPIPRTLQMSLSGVKQMSVLNTPPKNRYPIQTYVLEYNNTIIREAIERELGRKGQVYFLYNQVASIQEQADNIQKLVPNAKITYAHGQMSRDELEERVQLFIDGKYDVLVCTTIIETGIDISNANTLIVADSDRLGLAQLYQIRGRVGRTNRIAYAYLLYEKNKRLNEVAMKRLKVIKEFTELGSGYKIALRDLSIRGAGDILGSQQSGFVNSVGFDMFLEMLKDEVNQTHKYEPKEIKETIKLDISKYIPDQYVSDNFLKIEIHKKIANIEKINDINSLKEEFEDRFGRVPRDVYLYMHEQLFSKLQSRLDIEKVNKIKNKIRVVFTIEGSKKININSIGKITFDVSDNIQFEFKNNRFNILLDEKDQNKYWIEYINIIFERYLNNK